MSGNVVMSGISENIKKTWDKNEAQATLVLRAECKKQVICVPGAEDARHTTFINLNVLHAGSAETLAALSEWPLCGRPFPRIPRHWSWQPRNWIMHFDVLCQLCFVLKIIQNSLKTSKGVWMFKYIRNEKVGLRFTTTANFTMRMVAWKAFRQNQVKGDGQGRTRRHMEFENVWKLRNR